MKYGELPWTLHRLVSDQWDHSEREGLCRSLVADRACNIGLFAASFRRRHPTIDRMMSVEGRGDIAAWERGKLFSTKGSELGHASELRALSSSTGPGKAWLHHARRHVLEKAKEVHVAHHGVDPTKPTPLRKAPPQQRHLALSAFAQALGVDAAKAFPYVEAFCV